MKDRKTIQFLELLPTGAGDARSSRYFCTRVGVTRQTLSGTVELLRRRGIPICSLGRHGKAEGGYYIAKDQKELDDFIFRQKRRGNEVIKTGEAMERLCPSLYTGSNARLTDLERREKIIDDFKHSKTPQGGREKNGTRS